MITPTNWCAHKNFKIEDLKCCYNYIIDVILSLGIQGNIDHIYTNNNDEVGIVYYFKQERQVIIFSGLSNVSNNPERLSDLRHEIRGKLAKLKNYKIS